MTWQTAMCAKLHRTIRPNGICRDPKCEPGATDALGLAQEFQDQHRKGALHHFLEAQIPNGDFKPGELHIRLLKLPWREIFTTNWDTLLERTRLSVSEQRFDVVHNVDQLPIAKQPRIFKLHGSVGGHYPLIATSDDYEKYPATHAPFVNTVQQSMMETVLLLIGFSGTDPNFLSWTKWVNKNLGASAPRIYIAGFLGLSDLERERYICRNVVAIDLAKHPKAELWPENLKYEYAANWILTALEFGRPYDVMNWPNPDEETPADPIHPLKPLERVTTATPINEPWRPERSEDSQVSVEAVREVVRIWSHNRRLYPGWLMAPIEIRSSIVSRTRECHSYILQSMDELSPTERINAMRELIWRYEITLQPLTPEIVAVAYDVLAMFNCEDRTVEGHRQPDAPWSAIREAWRETALALVTYERFQLNRERFIQGVAALDGFLADDPDVEHRLQHERCLWSALSLDFEGLNQLLVNWNTDNGDPMWVLRKAALLAELGSNEQVSTLRDLALADVERFPEDDRSVTRSSREGWGSWSKINFANQSNVVNHWNELASRKCDAHAELTSIKTALSGSAGESDGPDFDGRVIHRRQIIFSNADSTAPAHRAIRITEIAGLALATRNPLVYGASGAEIVQLAATRIEPSNAELAIRLVLRSGSSDDSKELTQVLSRNHVAVLTDDAADKLAADCWKLIEFSVSEGNLDRLRVAIEVVSRLVPRLQSQSASETFDKALALYRNRRDLVASHFTMGRPLRNLLTRAWKTLDQESQTARVFEILGSPIVGLDNFTVQNPSKFPDPGELLDSLPQTPMPTRDTQNDAEWRGVIDILLRSLKTGGQSRDKALIRLLPISIQGVLTDDETSHAANALWAERTSTDDWFPTADRYADWVFLILPEAEDQLADKRFRRKWLSDRSFESKLENISTTRNLITGFGSDANDPRFIEDTIWNLGEAIANLPRFDRSFELTNHESAFVTSMISKWAEASMPNNPFPMFQDEISASFSKVIQGLGSVLPVVDVPELLGEALFQKFVDLTEAGIQAYVLVAGLIRACPHRSNELAAWLRKGLAASDREEAVQAMSGLVKWIQSSEGNSCANPPEDLIREIGFIIAARRKENVAGALEVAAWLFAEGKQRLWELLTEPTLDGLNYLASELSYDQEPGDEETYILRLRCAKLASSISKAGWSDKPAVKNWLEIAANDPFPEIRQSLGN